MINRSVAGPPLKTKSYMCHTYMIHRSVAGPPPHLKTKSYVNIFIKQRWGIRGIAPLFGDLNLLYCGNKKKQGKLIPCRGSKKKCNPIAVVVWVWVCLVFFRIKCYLLYMAKTLKNKMKK